MPRTHRLAAISCILVGIVPFTANSADLFSDSVGVTYWEGAYAGVHLGGGLGTAGSLTTGGTVVGAHGGYNFQAGRFVSGGEIDYSASELKNNSSSESFNQNWLMSIRGRGGYTFGNLLTYGTLGFAYGPTEYVKSGTKTDLSKSGWVLGGGIEAMIAPNVSLRGEFLHYDLGSGTYANGAGGTVSLSTTSNIIRTGLNYKF